MALDPTVTCDDPRHDHTSLEDARACVQTCPATKGEHRCIKFVGHPGRCRFARVYRERL